MQQVILKQFMLCNVIGEGSYGRVYKVKRYEDNQFYAMKKIKLSKLNGKEQMNALLEIAVMASIKHQNVVSYKESFFDEEKKQLYVIMEYAEKGDLSNQINAYKNNMEILDEHLIWSCIYQMVSGLQALHQNKIMHRDIKSSNVLIFQNGLIKLADLNVAKYMKNDFTKTQTGTPYYCSPEIFNKDVYSYKSDIWSLGCVIYEMCAQRPPFQGCDQQQLLINVMKGKFQRIPLEYSNELLNLIQHCLSKEPSQRPSCDSILNNPIWLSKMNGKNLNILHQFDLNLIQSIPTNFNKIQNWLPQKQYDNKNQEQINVSKNINLNQQFNLPKIQGKINQNQLKIHKIIEQKKNLVEQQIVKMLQCPNIININECFNLKDDNQNHQNTIKLPKLPSINKKQVNYKMRSLSQKKSDKKQSSIII